MQREIEKFGELKRFLTLWKRRRYEVDGGAAWLLLEAIVEKNKKEN